MERQSSNRSALVFAGAILAAAAIAAVIVLLAGDDGDDGAETASGLPEGCQQVEEPAPKEVSLKAPDPLEPPPPGTTATVSTSCGDFVITLDTEQAPKTTASFVHMAEQGAYDDTSINRIAPDFVIQGGDPTETQAGNAGYTVEEQPPRDLMYERAVVAMAKSAAEPPGTSGSQFFVVIAPAVADLPPDYALLGKVDTGFEIVERIASIGTDTGGDGPPKEPVVIQRMTIAQG